MASEWADIRHAREAKEAEDRKKEAEEKKKVEEGMKKAQEKQKAEKAKKVVAEKVLEEKKSDKKRKIADMLEESEGVGKNIAKTEKKLKTAATQDKKWMDVVMGA